MALAAPRVTVVIATRNRPDRLAAMLGSLADQTLAEGDREVIVVDDASTLEEVDGVLAHAERAGVRVIRRAQAGGPGAARNSGWREAQAPLVAFTDDDCVAAPDWLDRLLAGADSNPGAIVQGRTDPIPEEEHLRSPFSRTRVIHELGPPFEACNVLYPRAALESLEGFDESLHTAGEDTDLAWRAVQSGVPAVFVGDARVFHAVLQLGPLGMLRDARRWEHAVAVFARHPGLRKTHLHLGIFWSVQHAQLMRFLAAVPLARHSRLLALALAWPYLVHLAKRRTGPLLAPYILLYDLVETYAIVRGALRSRVLMI